MKRWQLGFKGSCMRVIGEVLSEKVTFHAIFERWEAAIHCLGRLFQVDGTARILALKQEIAWNVPESVRKLLRWQNRAHEWKCHKEKAGSFKFLDNDSPFSSNPVCSLYLRRHLFLMRCHFFSFWKVNKVAIRTLDSEARLPESESNSAVYQLCALGFCLLICTMQLMIDCIGGWCVYRHSELCLPLRYNDSFY